MDTMKKVAATMSEKGEKLGFTAQVGVFKEK